MSTVAVKPGYVVVEVRAATPEAVQRYRELSTLAVAAHGGRFLVRGAPCAVLEGDWQPERLVIVEFPSIEIARAFYDSPEYRAAREARAGLADFDMLLVEAY